MFFAKSTIDAFAKLNLVLLYQELVLDLVWRLEEDYSNIYYNTTILLLLIMVVNGGFKSCPRL